MCWYRKQNDCKHGLIRIFWCGTVCDIGWYQANLVVCVSKMHIRIMFIHMHAQVMYKVNTIARFI